MAVKVSLAGVSGGVAKDLVSSLYSDNTASQLAGVQYLKCNRNKRVRRVKTLETGFEIGQKYIITDTDGIIEEGFVVSVDCQIDFSGKVYIITLEGIL